MKLLSQYVVLFLAFTALCRSVYLGWVASNYLNPPRGLAGRLLSLIVRKRPEDFIAPGWRLYTRHVIALAAAVAAMFVAAVIGHI